MSFISELASKLANKQGKGIEIRIGDYTFICSNFDKEDFEFTKLYRGEAIHLEFTEDGNSLYTKVTGEYSPHWQDCFLKTKEGVVWFISVLTNRT